MKKLSVFLIAICAFAQDEAALRRFFEGRTVRVKIDMPGSQEGVDVRWRQQAELDMKAYSQRLKKYPVSIANGDSVIVTMVRLKSKNIEFQLGGGGYGTLGDDTGDVSVPSVSRSSRQQQLEKDVKNEKDSRRRDDMNREIRRLEDDRRRQESRERARADELRDRKRFEVDEKRRRAGSRFNVWFPDKYLAESVPTPERLMGILGQWVEFGGEGAQRRQSAPEPPPPAASPALRRGMSRDEVVAMMGKPSSSKRRQEGSLAVVTETWNAGSEVTEVDFVDGLVLKYRISSK